MPEVKSTGTGIVLSFFWTGLGQLYAGRIARGLILMALTPVIWVIGWIGGFSAMVGSLGSLLAPTAREAAVAGGYGIFGVLFALAPAVWWVWGMIDAKSLCEDFNRSATAQPGAA